MREGNKAAEENYPITSIAGNVAGALALPVGATAKGVGFLPRLAQGAGVGARADPGAVVTVGLIGAVLP